MEAGERHWIPASLDEAESGPDGQAPARPPRTPPGSQRVDDQQTSAALPPANGGGGRRAPARHLELVTDIATFPTRRSSLPWVKSSYSGGEGNECVTVAPLHAHVAVRDSKVPNGDTLIVSAAIFAAFVEGLKR